MSRVQRRDNEFRKEQTNSVKQQRIRDLLYSGEIVTDAELSSHNASKTGVHGIPSMSNGQGLLWNGTDWVATDLATQSELNAVDTRLASLEASPPVGSVFLARAEGQYGAGTAANSFWVSSAGGAITNGALSATSPHLLKWDASEWARTGKTTKWWLHGAAYTNSATFGTITYGCGFRRISSVGGAAGGIAYSMVTNDPDARTANFVNPTGGASNPAPGVLTPPISGNYGAFISNTTTTPSNSWISMYARIYVYWE